MKNKLIRGVVVSTKNENTAVVKVEVPKQHPVYEKRFIMHKKYHAHYNGIDLEEGDNVLISECAPISRKKHWLVKEVIKE